MDKNIINQIENVEKKLKVQSEIWLSEIEKHELVKIIDKDSSIVEFITNYKSSKLNSLERLRRNGSLYSVIMHVEGERYHLNPINFDSQISNFKLKNITRIERIEYYFTDKKELLLFRNESTLPVRIPDFIIESY